MLDSLGYVIHPEKSVLEPVQAINYGIFNWFIKNEHLTYTWEEIRIKDVCDKILRSRSGTIKEIASLIGTLIASFPTVPFGPLYYRNLDNEKEQALKHNNGWWECEMHLTDHSLEEIGGGSHISTVQHHHCLMVSQAH